MYKKRSAVLLIDPSLICQILTTFQMITLQKKKKKKKTMNFLNVKFGCTFFL